MTSPPATTSAAGVAMATTAPTHGPPNIEFTAGADNAAQSINDIPTLDTSATSANKSDNRLQEKETIVKQEDFQAEEEEHDTAEPSIPEMPPPNAIDASQIPLQVATEPPQMEGLSALAASAFAQPSTDYDSALLPPTGPSISSANGLLINSPMTHEPSSEYTSDQTHRISAYAMLEFEDGQFYMTTYSVILGRDLSAARAAMRREAEEQQLKLNTDLNSKEPKTPVRIKREESRYSKSVVSESGGILREGNSDSDDNSRRRKLRKASKKSKSTGSSSQPVSRRNSLVQANGRIDYQPQSQVKLYDPDLAGPAPVDPASLRPSPYECPLVGIHPPAATPASGYKAISRKHVKISYNTKKTSFEAEIIGRNGAFVDDMFYYHHDIVPLKSGSLLQIGGVVVRFILPDVAIGQTTVDDDRAGRHVEDTYAEGGKQMSFDFEDTPRDGALLEDTSESEVGEHSRDDQDEDEDEENAVSGSSSNSEGEFEVGEEEADDIADEEVEEGDMAEEPEPAPQPPKRRGPGRPPKNGIMSKREQQLAKKEAQQRAKKSLPEPVPVVKNKVGRPRKHPRPESPPVKREKRKYTKRKSKDATLADVKQEGSGDEGQVLKDKKDKKSTKPPRSPTPTFNEEELTEEQLAKPSTNYVNLIYEAISNSPTGQMSLPQIYRAIQRKYPFFVLKCTTNGWQSSVRHNLSQHHAFKKVERDGKGWLWAIVDGVSIEKEKKRRATPPHQLPPGHIHHQPIYRGPPPPHMMSAPPGMVGVPLGYPVHGHLTPNLGPGQPPQYLPQQPGGYPLQVGHPPSNGSHPLTSFQPGLPPNRPGAPQNSTYSSPYAPKPNPPPHGSHAPSNSVPEQKFSGPGTPSSIPPPGGSYVHPSQQPNEQILHAVNVFKTALVSSLKGKSNNAEAVVASAINRVLGYTAQSTVPGDPHEERIMVALRGMLSKIPGANFPVSQGNNSPQNVPPSQIPDASKPQTTSILHPPSGTTSGTALSGVSSKAPTPTSAPTVPRPSFTSQGQNRQSGASTSVPRPSMMTPAMKRTNSGSPATVPVRPETGNSDSAAASGQDSKNLLNDNGKRKLDDVEDETEGDSKRLETNSTSPLKV